MQIWKLKFGHKAKFLFWAREEGLVGSCSRQPTKLVYKSVSRLTLLWLPQPVRASQVPFHLLNCPPLPPPSPTTITTHWNTFQTLHKVYKYSKKMSTKQHTLSSWCIIWTIYELTSFTLKLTSPPPPIKATKFSNLSLIWFVKRNHNFFPVLQAPPCESWWVISLWQSCLESDKQPSRLLVWNAAAWYGKTWTRLTNQDPQWLFVCATNTQCANTVKCALAL